MTPPQLRLLSSRFRRPAGAVTPSMGEVVAKLSDGRFVMVPTTCPCGEASADVVIAHIDRYRLPLTSVLCRACGTVRFDPYLDASSLADFYTHHYQRVYGRAVDPVEYFDRQQVYGRKVIAGFGGGVSSVLEVGCGAGGGLAPFHTAGVRVAGCDLSLPLIEYGRERGVPNLHVGSVGELGDQLGREFDLVFLHHVFEHISDPLGTLTAVGRLLAPGGRVLVIVPNLDGIHDHPFPAGDALQYLHIGHAFNYTPSGLLRTAGRVGFAGRRVTPPQTPTAWSHAPELWVELRLAAAPDRSKFTPEGDRRLRYLLRTERLYRVGLCPAQIVAAVGRVTSIGRLFRRLRGRTP